MKSLTCKNCGGSDLRVMVGHSDLVKCNYCGSIYQLDSSGNILKQQEILKYNKIIIYLVIVSILISFFILVSIKEESKISHVPTNRESLSQESISMVKEEEGVVSGEIVELTEVTDFSSDYAYFIGKYKNTGTVTLEASKIQISFYDEQDNLINTDVGFGYKIIEPQEETGFQVLTSKKNLQYKKVIEHFPNKLSYNIEKVNLKLSEVRLIQEQGFLKQHVLIGQITNESDFPAKFVSVNCIIYDSQNQALQMSSTYISQKELKPNIKVPFKITFYNLNTMPSRYWIETNGVK